MSQKLAWIVFFVLFAATVGAGVIAYTTVTGNEAALAAEAVKIDSLRRDVTAADTPAVVSDDVASVIATETGVTKARLADDAAIVNDFLTKACNWSNFKEYVAARDSVMADYGLAPDSEFMIEFMPEVVEYTDNAGNVVNDIDHNHINMFFTDVHPYLTNVDESTGEQTYFALATIGSRVDSKVSGETEIALTYTINDSGQMYNVDAIRIVS